MVFSFSSIFDLINYKWGGEIGCCYYYEEGRRNIGGDQIRGGVEGQDAADGECHFVGSGGQAAAGYSSISD